MEEFKNIIVRMPNWIGDAVMATPILADLKLKFKNAEITAMCQSNVAPVLKGNPYAKIFSYFRPNGWIHRQQHGEIIHQIQRGKYDLGLLLTNSFSSAWWFWRGKVLKRIGFAANLRSFLLTTPVPFPQNQSKQHLVLTYKALLSPLGIPLSKTSPKLYVSQEEREESRRFLASEGFNTSEKILVGINPGAAFGSAKCWLPDRFVAVSKRLLEDPKVRIIFFGDTNGAALVNGICQSLPPDKVLNLAGRTNLREFLALITLCQVFLSNDSGPMHLAAALKVPLVALFGSTSEVKTGPYQFGKVIHKHVECSPCYKRVCPIDFRCMKQIEVEEVYFELRSLIDQL